MKKTIISILVLSSISAFANPEKDIARVRVAMKAKVGISNQIGDVRLLVSKVEDTICGGAGNSIIAEFQVRKHEKALDTNGSVILKSKFETVKTYGIPASAVSQLTDQELKSEIMDSEACLE